MKNYTCSLMKRYFLSVLFISFSFIGLSQQVAKGITAKNGKFFGFWEHVPSDYAANPNTKYPLIIFLHGGGEKGNGTTELPRVSSVGGTPPRLIQDGDPMRFTWNGKTESFIVLSPQCRSDSWWWENWYVDEILDYAKNNLRIDPDRIYLTGLSMGGNGTWDYSGASLDNAKKFAAVGVSCGGCQTLDWCNFAKANLPVWAFHAMDDGAIPYMCTVTRIDNINACNPAVKPYMTIWPDGNHYIWGRVYDPGYQWQNPNLYEWFLGHNKSLPVNQLPVAVASDQTITAGTATVTLDASGSYDPDGKVVRYVWRKISGPNTGTIGTAYSNTSSTTTITGLNLVGTYQYELKVVDDRADWSTKTITVTVTAGPPGSQKPIAKPGADITITQPASSVTLDGSGSYDPDGTIAAYAWSQVSGPNTASFSDPSIAKPTVSGLIIGTYTFRLTVTDNSGNTGSADVKVTVKSSNIFPVVKAGPDQTITLPTNSVTVDASASYDPDGTLAAFQWSYLTGPSQYTIVSPRTISTQITNLVEGTYTFMVRIWDNLYDSANDTLTITVKPAPTPVNRPPVANAGSAITITLPTNSTTLNGSASSDPDNNISSYQWSKVSGPSQYTIGNPAAASTSLTNLVEGVYLFRLLVTDSGGLSSSDTVKVTVNPAPHVNQPPIANAGANISITLPVNSTTLNGSASYDPDGTISSYAWAWISGPSQYSIGNAGAVSTPLTNLVEGVYQFRLTVTDNGGLSASDTIKITVKPAPPVNKPPVANAGSEITITLPTNSTTLNGSASYDPDGTISSYAWAWISGPAQYTISNATAATTALSNLVQGTYAFRLTVTDNGGLTSSDTVRVIVNPIPNRPPVANAGADISITLPTNSTTLNGSASSDPDNNITSYLWSRVSGPAQFSIGNATQATTSLTNLVEGTYVFRLTVTDAGGLSSSASVTVVVNPKPNIPPIANAGADFSVSMPNPVIQLNGSRSSDPDGTIVAYVWTRISGTGAITIANANTAIATVVGVQPGEYVFELTVTDDKGATAKARVKVTVLAAVNQKPVANAGADTVINFPASIVWLNGSQSYDPDGVIVTSTWKQIDGPGAASIVSPNSVTTMVTSLGTGKYVFELTVTDNKGASGKDSVTVTVVNNFRYQESLSVYPNPTRGNINITCLSDSSGPMRMTIFDANGSVVRIFRANKAQPAFTEPVSVMDLKPGMYYLEVLIDNKKRMITKFVKQ